MQGVCLGGGLADARISARDADARNAGGQASSSTSAREASARSGGGGRADARISDRGDDAQGVSVGILCQRRLATLQHPWQRTTGAARTPRKERPPPTAPTSCAKHSPAVTKQPRVLGRKRRWICASPLASGQRALQGGEPRKEHPPSTASTPALSTGPAVTRQPRVLGPSRHQSPPDVTSHPISLTPTGPRQGPSH